MGKKGTNPTPVTANGTCTYQYDSNTGNWNFITSNNLNVTAGCSCPENHMGHIGSNGEKLTVDAICPNQISAEMANTNTSSQGQAKFQLMIKRFKQKGKAFDPSKTDDPAGNAKFK